MRTTVVAGAHDLLVTTARELARVLPDAELIELPWAGHPPSLGASPGDGPPGPRRGRLDPHDSLDRAPADATGAVT